MIRYLLKKYDLWVYFHQEVAYFLETLFTYLFQNFLKWKVGYEFIYSLLVGVQITLI